MSVSKVCFPLVMVCVVLALIEIDNILITKDGYENLTTAVKDVAEMERIINGS